MKPPPPTADPTAAGATYATGVTGTTPERPDTRALDLPALTARYVDLGVLGTGGMAVVHRVLDRLLDRRVAMKVLAPRLAADATARARFLREARVLGTLRHPGIVPMHDLGGLPDGRPFFTMDEVRGRSFEEVLREGSLSLPARIGVFARVCATTAYAHTRGVLHRDLKPANVMLGDEGEVRVVDWGIARAGWVGPTTDRSAGAEADETSAEHTRFGVITGTPAYMAPEQAAGDSDAVGPHTDVYALGALLYALLAGRPPYTGRDPREVLAGPPPSVRDGVGEALPDELVALCAWAMARAPADRPGIAEVGAAVEAWLAGAQRVAHARAALDAAETRVAEAVAARVAADQVRFQWIAREFSHALQAGGEVARSAHWNLEDEAVALDVRATLLEEEAMRALRGALAEAPDLPETRTALAERLLDALRDAEEHSDANGARAIAQELVEQVAALPATWPARRRLEAGLAGAGTLSLATDPPGAEVLLARFEERQRRLVEVPAGTLGPTPLREVPVGMGSWMLTVRAPGCADVRLPVVVRRGERWARLASGEPTPRTLRLPRLGELGPDDCYVPAGWFVRQRTWLARWPIRRVWSESFVMRRFPVTNREYIAFLDDLVATGRREEALEHAPRRVTGSPMLGYALADDRFVLRPDDDGARWDPEWPVVHIGPCHAETYAAWLAARTGQPWRLPTEDEWLHAARGADGRGYPMGDHIDPAWVRPTGDDTQGGRMVRVGACPADVSPFGVRDLVAGVVDFVAEPGPDGPLYALRGGTFGSLPTTGRLETSLQEAAAEGRARSNGFRVARSAP